jgi:hypothetical protein
MSSIGYLSGKREGRGVYHVCIASSIDDCRSTRRGRYAHPARLFEPSTGTRFLQLESLPQQQSLNHSFFPGHSECRRPASPRMLSRRFTSLHHIKTLPVPSKSAVTARNPTFSVFTTIQRQHFHTTVSQYLRMSIITEAPKASSSTMPEWVPPTPQVPEPVLKVYNSLTRSKVRYVPLSVLRSIADETIGCVHAYKR